MTPSKLREKLEKILESGNEERIELVDKILTEFILLDRQAEGGAA